MPLTYYQPLLSPVPGEKPCGVSLEYDSAFILLISKLQPKMNAEYGHFIEAAESVNWVEVERDCLTLLQKSKDIRLIITLMRCRLRQKGLHALEEGLLALHTLLLRFPEDLYPQLIDEGEFDPLMRANAFAELEDSDGLMADLRNQNLPVVAGRQVTVKEYEKAHALPREEGAISQDSLDALRSEWEARADSVIASLIQAATLLQQIEELLQTSLGSDAPEFPRLHAILALFGTCGIPLAAESALVLPEQENESEAIRDLPVLPEEDSGEIPDESSVPVTVALAPFRKPLEIEGRADALLRLKAIRLWFEQAEPSSPVPLLLTFAEKTTGMSFSSLTKLIPADIIALLSTEEE
ncbi:type VI secretion system protein TssA [Buttiauxella agrestis]|uniref:type VI secretion system protein TssA n=1 Tax=Buttiauxella agrestis TaxID=82977 RepID=UPI003974CAAA